MDNEDRFKRVIRVTNKLSDHERSTLKLYLDVFYAPFSKNGSIYSRMFDLTQDESSFSDSKYSELLDDLSTDALRKNIERYEEKILESIVLPINISRESNEMDPIDKDHIRALNYLQIFKRLSSLGELDNAIRTLRKALKIFRRLEQFDFSIYCLNQLSAISIFRLKKMKSVNFEKEFEQLEIMRSNYYVATRLRESSFRFYLIDNLNEKQKKELDTITHRSDLIKNEPYSASVDRNILYIKLLYFDKINDVKSCLEICERLKNLVSTNGALKKKREIDTIEINLAQFYVLDRAFDKSDSIIQDLLKRDSLSDINRAYVFVVHCRNLLSSMKVDECIDAAREGVIQSWMSPLFKEQLLLIKAYSHYLSRDPKTAILNLDDIFELKKDKSGWNYSFRVLIILCFYAMSNLDAMITEIENFRRYIHGKDLTKRQKHHAILIYALAENTLNRTLINLKPVGVWDPTSSEIVDLDKVFIDLVQNETPN